MRSQTVLAAAQLVLVWFAIRKPRYGGASSIGMRKLSKAPVLRLMAPLRSVFLFYESDSSDDTVGFRLFECFRCSHVREVGGDFSTDGFHTLGEFVGNELFAHSQTVF